MNFISTITDWATIAAASDFPGNTYVANTTTPKTVTGDNGDDDIDVHNTITLIDLLEPDGITYKVYEEDYPTSGQCWLGTGVSLYKRKHNPFISFSTYTSSSTRCSAEKDFNDLHNDMVAGSLPNFTYIVPNLAHDGHDHSLNRTAIWYTHFINNLTQSPLFASSRVLVHVAFDEDDTAYTYYQNAQANRAGIPNPYRNASCVVAAHDPPNICAPAGCTDLLQCTLDTNQNKVYSILFGSAVPKGLIGTSDNTYYTHSSIVATIEANWGLGNLGREDVASNVFYVGQTSDPPPSSSTTTATTYTNTATSSNGSITPSSANVPRSLSVTIYLLLSLMISAWLETC